MQLKTPKTWILFIAQHPVKTQPISLTWLGCVCMSSRPIPVRSKCSHLIWLPSQTRGFTRPYFSYSLNCLCKSLKNCRWCLTSEVLKRGNKLKTINAWHWKWRTCKPSSITSWTKSMCTNSPLLTWSGRRCRLQNNWTSHSTLSWSTGITVWRVLCTVFSVSSWKRTDCLQTVASFKSYRRISWAFSTMYGQRSLPLPTYRLRICKHTSAKSQTMVGIRSLCSWRKALSRRRKRSRQARRPLKTKTKLCILI